ERPVGGQPAIKLPPPQQLRQRLHRRHNPYNPSPAPGSQQDWSRGAAYGQEASSSVTGRNDFADPLWETPASKAPAYLQDGMQKVRGVRIPLAPRRSEAGCDLRNRPF